MGRKSPAPSPWGTQHHLQLCDLLPSWTLFIIPWNLQDLYFVLPPSWLVPNTLILEFFDSLTSKTLLSPVPYRHLQLFHSQECFITTGAFQLPQFLPSYQPFPITETPRSPISPLQCFSYSMTHCLNHSFAVQSLYRTNPISTPVFRNLCPVLNGISQYYPKAPHQDLHMLGSFHSKTSVTSPPDSFSSSWVLIPLLPCSQTFK